MKHHNPLQEEEIAKARAKDVRKQDSSCQYDPRDLHRLDNPRQYYPRLTEPAFVGSTDTTQKDVEIQVLKLTNNQNQLLGHIHPRLPHCPDIHKAICTIMPMLKTLLQPMGQTKIVTIEVNITMVVITRTKATTLKIQDAITEVDRIVEVIGLQHQEMVQAIEMLTSMSPIIQL